MKKIQSVLALVLAVAFAASAFAEDHPMSPKHRIKRQHARIHQGVKNGTITPADHAKLAKEGKRMKRERKRDLKKNHGKLTPAEHAKIEHQENVRSEQIKQDKHN